MSTTFAITETVQSKKRKKFIDEIKKLPDKRDNRGKRHSLHFLIITVVLAFLSGRSKMSGIHRYMANKIKWLRKVTGVKDATPISRAHLPRMLAQLDWDDLNVLISDCFGVQIRQSVGNEWIAVDGKTLRGTLKSGEKQAIVHAVSHDSRIDVAQARLVGEKSSEITVVRDFLKDTGLEKNHITLDAHHCNPETTAQIEQAGGGYLVQVKENQPILLAHCQQVARNASLTGAENQTVDPGHGRITTRQAQLFSMASATLDARWQKSAIRTLIVIHRETFNTRTEKATAETSYYISNQTVSSAQTGSELADTLRKHWGVESNNWILDVTFNEDGVQVKNGNQAQVLGKLRCFATNLLRWSGAKNFQEKIEEFIDLPETLISTLGQVNFL